jgi:hypothetical protein
MKSRRVAAPEGRGSIPAAGKPSPRVMSGQYLLLYEYLENRYANTVVLTFAQIEDLLGFTLPERARLEQEWWTNAETGAAASNHRDSWILASRTATPNLSAKIVVFDRAS